jgi:hypothetical protein
MSCSSSLLVVVKKTGDIHFVPHVPNIFGMWMMKHGDINFDCLLLIWATRVFKKIKIPFTHIICNIFGSVSIALSIKSSSVKSNASILQKHIKNISKTYKPPSALNAHNLWKLSEVTSSIVLSTAMTTTTIVNEHRSLTTTSTFLINSFFMKLIVWMCLTTAVGIPRDSASSSLIIIQKRIAAHRHVASSSPLLRKHKEEVKKNKERHQILQPSLVLSLPIEIFAFDYFYKKTLPVATILPSKKYSEFFQINKKPEALDDLSFHNSTTVTGASTSAHLGGLLGNSNTEFVLPSFGFVPYDYFSSTLLLTMDHELEEQEAESKFKEEDTVRHGVKPSSSWSDYVVVGCEGSHQHWNCGMIACQGYLFCAVGELVLILSALLSVIVARVSYYSSCRNNSVPMTVVRPKKSSTAIPPLGSTCHHPNHHHCRCRPKKQFPWSTIPKVPTRGYRRVLVPTPGTKCGEHGYIIVREVDPKPPLPHKITPAANHRTPLCTIPEIPSGYTRVLAPIPGTKCAEYDYIVVRENGELLQQDNAVSAPTVNKEEKPIFAPPAPRKKSSRRIGIREKILPFELHGRIIKYAQDHCRWTIALMREYHHQKPELFLLARKITRDSNFFRNTVGDCASSLGYFIEPIVEEECIGAEDVMELFDDSNSHSIAAHPVLEERHQEEEDYSSTLMGMEHYVQEEVVCSTVGVATATVKRRTRSSCRPTEEELPRAEDGTQVCFYDTSSSSCNDDLLFLNVKTDVMSPPSEIGSGYYIDGKGRKRRFSLRIFLAKKKNKKNKK